VKYRHPLTSAVYELRDDGLIAVDEKGVQGVFDGDGRNVSGELTQADLHLLGWMRSKHLTRTNQNHPSSADARRHR